MPTLQVALLAAFNPGESIRFERAHVGLMSDRERERKESASVLCESEENPASGDTTALSHYNNALWTLVIKITP